MSSLSGYWLNEMQHKIITISSYDKIQYLTVPRKEFPRVSEGISGKISENVLFIALITPAENQGHALPCRNGK